MKDQTKENKNSKQHKEFKLTTASVKNQKTVFLITILILIAGLGAFNKMPKENFPELQIPRVYIGTPYPGNAPAFIEDKITKPFEEEINNLKDVEEIKSTTVHGYSSIEVEFSFKVTGEEARRRVQDAVDKVKGQKDFPKDLPADPFIQELDISNLPIMNINLSGDRSVDQLKEYGEILQDKIEALSEISKVDIRGVQDKELKVENQSICC